MYAKDYSYNCQAYKGVEDLYLKANDWLRTANFLQAELVFLKKVMRMLQRTALDRLRELLDTLQSTLRNLEVKRQELEMEISNHRIVLDVQLKEMIYAEKSAVVTGLNDEHQRLQSTFAALCREINDFKGKLFAATESVDTNGG